ncbi:hypothetical protein ACROYT_G040519 [Oculina patagonica]
MGALVAKKMVNWQSLQERLDLFTVYKLVHLYEQNIGPLPTCSYEKQYLAVHQFIEKQLEDCLGKLHKQVQEHVHQLSQEPFSLSIQKSSIPHPLAGNGVFLKGSAVPGSFLTFHPGLVYLSKDVPKMLNYPNISTDNCYLMSRYDGCILDAKDFNTDIQLPCEKRLTHPFAFGHLINHPAPGGKPNVMPLNYDIMESFQSDLVYLVPNRYYRVPGILYKTAAVIRTIIFIATEHIHNEELFVNYRMNPSTKLPDWYTPVDLEEDKRRWNAD